MKGDKAVAICDRNCNVIAPVIFAPGNKNESPLIREAMKPLKWIAKTVGFDLSGSIMSLDGLYDCRANRKKIYNAGMKPNINPNKRNRKKTKGSVASVASISQCGYNETKKGSNAISYFT